MQQRKTEQQNISDLIQGRLPPHSTEAEMSVIGGLMLDSECFDDIASVLMPEDFYNEPTRKLYKAIKELHASGQPFDLVTVVSYLGKDPYFMTQRGREYAADIVKNTPGSANIEYYAQSVKQNSTLRNMINVLKDSEKLCWSGKASEIQSIIDTIEGDIAKVAEMGVNNVTTYQDANQLLDKVIAKVDELFNSDGTITGLRTHLNDLDEITSGLQRGDLIIVAGRPSMGKTTFSMNIAENAAIKESAPVAVFSLEMPGEGLMSRMVSSVGRIESKKMRDGSFGQDDWPKLNKAVTEISQAQILIDETPALRINDLRSRARKMDKDIRKIQLKEAKEEGVENPETKVTGLGLIVIDYLQLMRGSTNTDNRTNEISEISRGLKALAKELDIPVIALSQLNRSLEQRPDKRPKMSDLRESGAIEQDADLIIFIYRDEVYNPETEDKGVAEVILGKHRNGSLGVVRLTFIGEYTRFENHAPYSGEGEYY